MNIDYSKLFQPTEEQILTIIPEPWPNGIGNTELSSYVRQILDLAKRAYRDGLRRTYEDQNFGSSDSWVTGPGLEITKLTEEIGLAEDTLLDIYTAAHWKGLRDSNLLTYVVLRCPCGTDKWDVVGVRDDPTEARKFINSSSYFWRIEAHAVKDRVSTKEP